MELEEYEEMDDNLHGEDIELPDKHDPTPEQVKLA